jgi:hypothetical protein
MSSGLVRPAGGETELERLEHSWIKWPPPWDRASSLYPLLWFWKGRLAVASKPASLMA